MQIFKGEYLQDREKASCGCTFCVGSICKKRKSNLKMHIFEGEYLQDRENASCGCKFLQESICKTEKEQVADALFGCGVSAR